MRTIGTHLSQDRALLDSIPGDSEFAISLRSHVIKTSWLLYRLRGGHGAPDTAPGVGGSDLNGPEGALSKITNRTSVFCLTIL